MLRKCRSFSLSQIFRGLVQAGLIFALLPLYSFAQPPQPTKWRMTFSDEFNGPALNTNQWMTTYFWGGRTNTANNELQYYADDAFEFQNGILAIRADNRAMNGFDYTSGLISSFGKFSQSYGYFEIRAKVPKGKGLWPAFWLMPDSKTWPPEVDILELLGQEPQKIYMTNHYSEYGVTKSSQGIYTGSDFSNDFHIFGLEWKPSSLTWYIDGKACYQTTTGIPQKNMYILINLAVGGNWPGSPDATTPFPSYYNIDYVRVYTLKR
jgi:beta-glucanase (GH16 family)